MPYSERDRSPLPPTFVVRRRYRGWLFVPRIPWQGMSRWREVVRRELHRYREQTGADVIERQDLLEQSLPVLEAEFPDAKTPGQTLSRILQELRDRGELEFLDLDGTYRILGLDEEAMASPGESNPEQQYEARTYETTVQARSMPVAFRRAALSWYDSRCPVSGVDHDGLLDVAHVLSWSDHPEYRTDPGNVLVLDKTHHEAFDRGLFTFDDEYRLRVAPDFETESDVLEGTLLDQQGDTVGFPGSRRPSPDYLQQHNETLAWW